MDTNKSPIYRILITFVGSDDDVEPIIIDLPSAVTKDQRDMLAKMLDGFTPKEAPKSDLEAMVGE